jgi:hypothetical protein
MYAKDSQSALALSQRLRRMLTAFPIVKRKDKIVKAESFRHFYGMTKFAVQHCWSCGAYNPRVLDSQSNYVVYVLITPIIDGAYIDTEGFATVSGSVHRDGT